MAAAPLFPWCILSTAVLSALPAFNSKDPPGPHIPGAEVADHPLLCLRMPILMLFHLGFRALFCLSPSQKGPEAVYSPLPARELACTSNRFPLIPRKAAARPKMSREGTGRQGLFFPKKDVPFPAVTEALADVRRKTAPVLSALPLSLRHVPAWDTTLPCRELIGS